MRTRSPAKNRDPTAARLGSCAAGNWTKSEAKSFFDIPEVAQVRFGDEGRDIEVVVRPWSEDLGEGQAQDAFDSYYRLLLSSVVARDWDLQQMKE